MIKNNYQRTRMAIVWLAVSAIFLMPISVFPQTRLTLHSNKYSTQDDIKLGRQAAAEAEQQFPLLRDPEIQSYVERVGNRLVGAIPSEFQHPGFQYYFRVVNARDINALALPGGPSTSHRGMSKQRVAKVRWPGSWPTRLAQSHYVTGTAQATKGQKYGTLAGIWGIAGQVIGVGQQGPPHK